MGNLKLANKKQGFLCNWLREHVWITVIGSKLEVGAEIKEAISY